MKQYIDTAQDISGNALPLATCKVLNFPSGTNASIFSDNGLTPIGTSIVSADLTGQFSFFVADGDYTLQLFNNGTLYKTQTPVSIFDGAPQVTFPDTGLLNGYAIANSALEKALRPGLRASFQAGSTNTLAATFQYNTLAVKPIVNPGGAALTAGAILVNGIYGLEYDGASWQLRSGTSAPPIFVRTAAEITAGVMPSNLAIPSHAVIGVVLPERYGAVGNGNSADLVNAAFDTAAINTAITMSAATLCAILFSRAYIAIPGTPQVGAATYNCAFALKSGVTFLGQEGASIKIQDGYSTNASPKEMAMFSTSVALANISWLGLLMDMNGANNLMSPGRPAVYNRFNHSPIFVNGPTGLINDVRIEDCTMQNTAGVCYILAQLVAAGTTPAMPVRWTIKNNLFLNGGSDTDDLTAVFSWAEDVLIDGNIIWQDNPPHTVGLTGGASGIEVHGARTRVVNNLVRNYKNGGYVATNFTNKTVDVVVANNDFYTSDYGILFFRQQTGNQTEIDNVIIAANNFYFDTTTVLPLWSDGLATRVCIGFEGGLSPTNQLAVNNIKIDGNLAIDNSFGSTSLLSCFVRWDTCQNVANQVCSNLSITNNEVIGFTEGVDILCAANAQSNPQGFTDISNNKFISLSPDSGALYDVVGIKVNASTGVKTLVIDGNQYIDERGAPTFLRGVLLLGAGTITDLCYGQQFFKGLTGQLYLESGVTVTNRKGLWVTRGLSGAVATGAAIAHGLFGTPTQVMLQQLDATPTAVFPGTLGPATFAINYTGGGTHSFAWQASIGSQFP